MENADPRHIAFLNARPVDQQCSELPEHDLGNARRLHLLFKDELRFTQGKGWFVYNGMVWQNDYRAAMRLASEVVDHMLNKEISLLDSDSSKKSRFSHYLKSGQVQRLNAMLKVAESIKELSADIDDFDSCLDFINTRTGIVNLKTGELLPHSSDYKFSKMTKCVYEADAECPIFSSCLETALPDTPVRDYMQRLLGYSLTGHTNEQMCAHLHGIGANSKSTIIETILDVLGSFSAVTSCETFVAQKAGQAPRPDLARLTGIRFVATSETPDSARMDEGLVKDLTGGDRVFVRDLYRDPIEYLPRFKIFFRGNYKPRIRGTDDGIWRRIHLIPFNVQIPPEKRDKKLREKIDQELPGVLRWLVQGAIEYYKQGLVPPSEVMNATADYRNEMDAIGRFIDNCCILKVEARVAPAELYKTYNKWAHATGEYAVPERKFGDELERRGYERGRSNGKRFYRGIGLYTDRSADSDT